MHKVLGLQLLKMFLFFVNNPDQVVYHGMFGQFVLLVLRVDVRLQNLFDFLVDVRR